MTLLCGIAGHSAETRHHRNQGLDFSLCHHCGCDLIRTDHGDWTEVPSGLRVVWHDPARFGGLDAPRMPPRRRVPRHARPAPRRDRRGRAFEGTAAMFGILASLGRLVSGEIVQDVLPKAKRGKPPRLPSIY